MATPGGLTPLDDLVSVSYQLINRNTLQIISHTGNSSITKYVRGTIKSVSKKTLAKILSYTLYSSCFDVLWSGVDDACDFYGHFDKPLA